MELEQARAQALSAYQNAMTALASRRDAAKVRDRLRKLSPSKGVSGLPLESQADWEWHRQNQAGFDRYSFETQRDEVLALTGPRGVAGYAGERAAGFVLLDWLKSTGAPITAMKFGTTTGDPGPDDNLYLTSLAVDFLAQQLVEIDPTLDAEDPRRPGSNLAIDAANRVTRLYLAAQPG